MTVIGDFPTGGPGHAPAAGNVIQLPAQSLTERQLQTLIIDLCRWHHLLCYHTHDSRRSARGFPDLVICGPNGVLFRELKAETGRLTIDQTCWGQGLLEAGANCAVWRPADWYSGRIRRELGALTLRLGDTP